MGGVYRREPKDQTRKTGPHSTGRATWMRVDHGYLRLASGLCQYRQLADRNSPPFAWRIRGVAISANITVPPRQITPKALCSTAQGCEATLGPWSDQCFNPERVASCRFSRTQPLRGRQENASSAQGSRRAATLGCVTQHLRCRNAFKIPAYLSAHGVAPGSRIAAPLGLAPLGFLAVRHQSGRPQPRKGRALFSIA